jgi:type I restriction enzyme S subunit
VKLGEVCELIMGQSPPGNTYTEKPEGQPFFQGKADFGEYFPTVRMWCTQPIKIAEDGDILISVRAPVGPVNISNLKCCIGRGLTAIRCKDNTINWFIFWYLRSTEGKIASLGSGSTFGAITRNDLVNIEIPLPPIEEQKRIAAKIQELMQEVERARTACEKQLEAAKALPPVYLREVFEGEKSKKWERKKLRDIGPVMDGDWILNADYTTSGVRLIQVGDIGVGRFVNKSSRFITMKRARELNCTFLEPGDILMSRMPDPIGRACQFPDLGYPCITAVDVSIWRPKIDITDRQYLTYYLNCEYWLNRVKALASGATRARISRSNLETLEIPIPPLPIQQQIASKLKEKMIDVENLQSTIQNQQSALNVLPQAILRKAFNGEL